MGVPNCASQTVSIMPCSSPRDHTSLAALWLSRYSVSGGEGRNAHVVVCLHCQVAFPEQIKDTSDLEGESNQSLSNAYVTCHVHGTCQIYMSHAEFTCHMHACYVFQLHMWQSQVENKHYSTLSGLIRLVIISRMVIPDFLCPFMNAQSYSPYTLMFIFYL